MFNKRFRYWGRLRNANTYYVLMDSRKSIPKPPSTMKRNIRLFRLHGYGTAKEEQQRAI